jgi:hypothetical protein
MSISFLLEDVYGEYGLVKVKDVVLSDAVEVPVEVTLENGGGDIYKCSYLPFQV